MHYTYFNYFESSVKSFWKAFPYFSLFNQTVHAMLNYLCMKYVRSLHAHTFLAIFLIWNNNNGKFFKNVAGKTNRNNCICANLCPERVVNFDFKTIFAQSQQPFSLTTWLLSPTIFVYIFCAKAMHFRTIYSILYYFLCHNAMRSNTHHFDTVLFHGLLSTCHTIFLFHL